ncbi:serine/threonine-protein kinase ZRK1-like [Malus domestica]|uniref:serine/threonine-protein kinase ZRK1-like n=1 Tax=Malus domestica TaxID=3750 RepID=UPI0010AB08AA|nr:probable serine/threonine-protein kinase PBL22 [Malus domestica]
MVPPKLANHSSGFKSQLTFGYLDPSFMKSGYITEKSDVYSFGVHLLAFLTGQKAVDKYDAGEYQSIIVYVKVHARDIGQIQTIVDPKIFGEITGDGQVQQHLHDFLALELLCTQDKSERMPDTLALELLCTQDKSERMPDTIDVAKELL